MMIEIRTGVFRTEYLTAKNAVEDLLQYRIFLRPKRAFAKNAAANCIGSGYVDTVPNNFFDSFSLCVRLILSRRLHVVCAAGIPYGKPVPREIKFREGRRAIKPSVRRGPTISTCAGLDTSSQQRDTQTL